MNQDAKILQIHQKDYVIQQSMVLKIQTFLKRVVNDFVVNAIGFQGINCPSYIYFNQKNNSNNL